jgi:hypothetical protein
MKALGSGTIRTLLILLVILLLSACAPSGPKPPAPGTPAYQWNRAQEAYKTGDFTRAVDLLSELAEGESEFASQARPAALLLSLGLANASMELSEKLDEAGKKNRTNPAPFRRHASEYSSRVKSLSMRYVELSHKFIQANQDREVTLVLEPPPATLDDPDQYKKFAIGQLIPDAELAQVEKQVVARELLRTSAQFLGVPKEPEKARAAFQTGGAKVAGPDFLLHVASGLYRVGEMFGPKKLDQPHRIKLVYDEALSALALVKDNKDAKDLTKKISDAQKKLKL